MTQSVLPQIKLKPVLWQFSWRAFLRCPNCGDLRTYENFDRYVTSGTPCLVCGAPAPKPLPFVLRRLLWRGELCRPTTWEVDTEDASDLQTESKSL